MNYKIQIERLLQIMRDYPEGSVKHKLAKEAFAKYIAEANKLAMGRMSWKS